MFIARHISTCKLACLSALLVSLVILGVARVAQAQTVWNAVDWTLYDTITIESDVVSEDLTNFPVYVDLADLSSRFWSTTPSASSTVGSDIRVTTDAGSPVELPRELVFASSTTQTGELHFKADSISSTTDTVFRIYYNGTTTDDYAPAATYGAQNVWTNSYVSVWHLGEDGNNVVDGYKDSTSGGYDGTGTSMTSASDVNGLLGKAQDFDGTADLINIPDTPALTGDNSFTVSFWSKFSTYKSSSGAVAIRDGTSASNLLLLYPSDNSSGNGFRAYYNGTNLINQNDGAEANDAWHQFVFTSQSSTNHEIFVDRVSEGTSVTSKSIGTISDITLGSWYAGSTQYFDGQIDEVRITSAPRSEAWMSAEYTNQATTTDFYSVAPSVIIDISGNLYQNDGVTAITSAPTVTLVVNGVVASSTVADGSGTYTFADIQTTNGAPLIIYFNENGQPYGSLITQASSSDLTGLDLYEDTVIVRQTTSEPVSIAEFLTYDSSDDSDLQFTASSTANSLSVSSGSDFLVWANSTFTAPSTLTITGNYTNDGVFNANSGTVVFAGAGQQTATGTLSGTSQFHEINVTNTSQSGDATQSVIFGVQLLASKLIMQASTSAAFAPNMTSTFNMIDWRGVSGSPVWVRSLSPGTSWGLVTGCSRIDYVRVKDSNAAGSSVIIRSANTIDDGNNTNWEFGDTISKFYWDGGGDNSTWEDVDNWSCGELPTEYDDVIIDSAVTVNINQGATINSLTVGSSTATTSILNFGYDASLAPLVVDDGDVQIENGATITHTDGTSVLVGSIGIEVQTGSFTLNTGATINLDYRGYSGGGSNLAGSGPGGGLGGNPNGSGGAYGGDGADGSSLGGDAYGSTTNPYQLGSGGGGGSTRTGGDGGGFMQLTVTGTTTINGTITADGAEGIVDSSNGRSGGGGSGGGVYINTGHLSGSGTIGVNGAASVDQGLLFNDHGAGGGGRIALHFSSGTTTGLILEAFGGGNVDSATYRGAAGTVYIKGPNSTYGEVIIDNNNVLIGTGVYARLAFATSTFDRLTVRDSGQVLIDYQMSVADLNLTSNGNLVVEATGDFTYTDMTWDSGGIITDRGEISIPASFTVPANAVYIADRQRTFANLTIDGTLTHSDNSTTQTYVIDLEVTGDFTLNASGTINVDHLGYSGGGGYAIGKGPGGGGLVSGYDRGAGGGYGGDGGPADESGVPLPQTIGEAYGSTTKPAQLGSGGSGATGGGGDGGGLVQLTVLGTTTIDGIITADGETGNCDCSNGRSGGSGSGGGIYINTNHLTGSGTIGANGAWSVDGGYRGYVFSTGGGGRVAVHYTSGTTSALTLEAFGGSNVNSSVYRGGAGTIYLKSPTDPNGHVIVDNNSVDTPYFAGLIGGVGTTTISNLTIQDYGRLRVSSTTNLEVLNDLNTNTNAELTNDGASITFVAPVTSSSTFSGTGGEFVFADDFTNAGIFTNAASSTRFYGDLINSGTVNLTSASTTFYSNLTNTGDFTATAGDVFLVGATTTITGVHTFYNLTKENTTGASETLLLSASTGQTISNVLDLQGASLSSPLLLRSTASGTLSYLTVAATTSFEYLDIKDNRALTSTLYATSSVDSGNNINWIINGVTFEPTGETVVWTGGGNGIDWEDGGNWLPAFVPGNLDTVVIDITDTVNLNESSAISALTLGSSTAAVAVLNFNYDATNDPLIILDGDVIIKNGATLTHSAGSSVVLGVVNLDVQTGDFTVEVGGSVSVNSKGYSAANGPGGGTSGTFVYNPGGSYGGDAGVSASYASADAAYGSTTNPSSMGSGGGSNYYVAGGRGGGLAFITVAGTTTIDGVVSSNGQDGTGATRDSGGGAGGSVYLDTDRITGSGSVTANGGRGFTAGGAGGGGRVAVYYATGTTDSMQVSAYGGIQTSNQAYRGGAGTVYLKNTTDQVDQIIIDNNNVVTPRFSRIGQETGSFTVYNLLVRNAGYLLAPSNTLNILGDFTNAAYFSANTATTTFIGTSAQEVHGDIVFNNLVIDNQSANGSSTQSVIFSGDVTTDSVMTITGSSSVEFAAGADYNFDSVNWKGTVDSPIYLRSSNDFQRWNLDIASASTTYTIEYVDVSGSDATLTNDGVFSLNATDSGNNKNWVGFTDAASPKVWSAAGWDLYDTIVIQHENIDDTLTDFPVYINLADLSATFWETTHADPSLVATDIRVTTNDSSPVELPRELVYASSTLQAGELHFKANTISSTTDTVFRIYYNGTTTGDYLLDATYGAQNVWSNGYVGVWHMHEDPSGSSPQLIDSTVYSGDATTAGTMTSADLVSAQIEKGIDYDGIDDKATISNSTQYSNLTAYTVSTWLKPVSETSMSVIGDNLTWIGGLPTVYLRSSTNQDFACGHDGTNYRIGEIGVDSPEANNWMFYTCTWNGSTIRQYVNSNQLGSGFAEVTQPTASTRTLTFAGVQDQTIYTGQLDEIRISSTTRPASWISAEYTNQSTTTDFYTVNLTPSTGTTTLANHDAGQVSSNFSFQNVINGELFAFKLTPSGTSTLTETVLTLTGARSIDTANFSNITLYRDTDNDALYDVTDTSVTTGVMSMSGQAGTITFTSDFEIVDGTNFLVVADWLAPERAAMMTIGLLTTGLSVSDEAGAHTIVGNVDYVQHIRNNRGGGGGSAAIGPAAPVADEIRTGGDSSAGEQIDGNPNYRWPTAHSGTVSSGGNAYDMNDGTYATSSAQAAHQYEAIGHSVPSSNAVTGIEVRIEMNSGSGAQSADVSLSWDGGTTFTDSKSISTIAATDVVYSLGGSSDLWGRTWTANEFSDANFVVRLTAGNDVSLTSIDAIQVRVYHEASGGSSGGGGGAI